MTTPHVQYVYSSFQAVCYRLCICNYIQSFVGAWPGFFLLFPMYQHKVHQSITCTVLQFSVENDIQMWKNIVCCFTMLHVNGLMQIVLFDNNSFSLFALMFYFWLLGTNIRLCVKVATLYPRKYTCSNAIACCSVKGASLYISSLMLINLTFIL